MDFLLFPNVNYMENFKRCVLGVNINRFGSKLEHIGFLAIGTKVAPRRKKFRNKILTSC